MYDLSIVIPSIRTHNWPELLKSLEESKKGRSVEVVFVGPFKNNEKLPPYVKFIESHRHPTACLQQGIIEAESDLIGHTVDDALFTPDSIDLCMNMFENLCGYKDVVNWRYTESENRAPHTMPANYWWASSHFNHIGIMNYRIALHFMMNKAYFMELGGFDCRWEHANFSIHDLMFRIQADGGRLYESSTVVTNCDWYPARKIDHGPIIDCQTQNDEPLFHNTYANPNASKERRNVLINNWKKTDEIWKSRFPKGIKSNYSEMVEAAQ